MILILRQDHCDVLLQADPVQFVHHVLHYVVEEMPDEIRGIPLPLVWDMIEAAIARARGHGLTTDEQIIGFVAVMFEIAPNFDQEPVLRRILLDPRRTAAQRWEALFAPVPALRAAWERAAHPDFQDPAAWGLPASEGGKGSGHG